MEISELAASGTESGFAEISQEGGFLTHPIRRQFFLFHLVASEDIAQLHHILHDLPAQRIIGRWI